MILIYLHGHTLCFEEDNYVAGQLRVGNLIEQEPGKWTFWPEKYLVGLDANLLSQIAEKITRLEGYSSHPVSAPEAALPLSCHIVPESTTLPLFTPVSWQNLKKPILAPANHFR